MLLYHLDRANSLPVNSTINLEPLISYNPQETSDFFLSIFEDGVSKMGQQYLNHCNYSDIVSVNTFSIEYIFENVRRNYFPYLPSRFTSIFAVETLDDLKQWYLNFSYNTPNIESSSIKVIEIENYILLDACWRDLCIIDDNQNKLFSPFAYHYYALQYWQGKVSNTPKIEALCPLPVTVVDIVPIDAIL